MIRLVIVVLIVTLGIVFYLMWWQGEDTKPDDRVKTPPPLAAVTKTEIKKTSIDIPPKAMLAGGKHIFQTFNNCGPASMSMALSYLNLHKTQEEIGKAIRPYQIPKGDNDDKSVTLSELAKYAEDQGMVAYSRPAGDMDLIKKTISSGLPVVTRTLLNNGEDIGHYRVIIGFDNNTKEIIQDDSLQGSHLRYQESEFNRLWKAYGYEYLIIAPKEKSTLVEEILGDQLEEKVAWENALEMYENESKKNPGDVQNEFNKAVALYHLGRYQEAVDSYEKVERKLPFRTLWYQIEPILSYYKLNNFDRVMTISNRVLTKENRAYSELHQLQGQIYQLQGQAEMAEESFRMANKYNTANYWKENLK